jgi:hypothetical protein
MPADEGAEQVDAVGARQFGAELGGQRRLIDSIR